MKSAISVHYETAGHIYYTNVESENCFRLDYKTMVCHSWLSRAVSFYRKINKGETQTYDGTEAGSSLDLLTRRSM